MSFPKYAEYVDSGVEWLEASPSNWGLFLGKRLFKQRKEKAYPRDEQLAASQAFGVVPQKKMMTLTGNKVMLALGGTDTFRHVEENDFVISLRSFEGGIEHSAYTGCVSPAYTVLTSIHTIVPLFYKYLFKSRPYIAALQASTDSLRDGKSITFEQFGAIPLPKPSVGEQTQIARFLDHETAKIDALIAEQKRLIELLKEKRQAVISHAVTKGLDPNVPMKDSGVEWLGEVPAHWKVIPLKNTIDSIKSGTSVNASDVPASDGEFGVLKTSCVYSGEFRAKENKTVLAEELSRLSCPVQVGTLIVSRMNTPDLVGAAGLVEVRVDNIFLPDRLWSVSFNETALPKYVYYWTRSESYRLQIKMVCAGTSSSMQNIGQDDFRSFSIALPPLAEQQLISSSLDDKLASFRLLTDSAGRAVELLMERRSALISAAVTGKIDVRDWQPPADESAFDEDVKMAGMEASE